MLVEGKEREGLQVLDEVISFFDAQFAPVLRVLGASVKAQRARYFLHCDDLKLAIEDMQGIAQDLSFQKDIRSYFAKELRAILGFVGDESRLNTGKEAMYSVLGRVAMKIPY